MVNSWGNFKGYRTTILEVIEKKTISDRNMGQGEIIGPQSQIHKKKKTSFLII